MNSEFQLINDDDISAFDIGTPAFLSSSWSSPTEEGLHPLKIDDTDPSHHYGLRVKEVVDKKP